MTMPSRFNDTIPQEAFDWYDEYAHGDIDRRTFLARLAAVGLTTAAVAGGLIPNYALAEQVSFNDPDIVASYAEFASPDGLGSGRGYLVMPKKRAVKTSANHGRASSPPKTTMGTPATDRKLGACANKASAPGGRGT